MFKQRSPSPREMVATPADLTAASDGLRAPRAGALSLGPTPTLGGTPASTPGTKLLLVDFRSGETVSRHPDVQAYLRQGWCIKSAAPRLVEAGGTKLLVVLTHPNADAVPAA